VDLRTDAARMSLTALVPATAVMMPRRLLEAIAIIFCEIKLCATACWSRIAIRVSITWKGDVGIVVDTAVRTSHVHVKLHKTACEVECGLGAHAPTPMDIPTRTSELGATIINIEILAWVWTVGGMPTRAWWAGWARR